MPSDPTTERRLTPAERQHEVVMALAQRSAIPPECSLELTRNAKQHVQIALTVRGYDLADVEAAGKAAFDRLCEAYPTPPNGGAS